MAARENRLSRSQATLAGAWTKRTGACRVNEHLYNKRLAQENEHFYFDIPHGPPTSTAGLSGAPRGLLLGVVGLLSCRWAGRYRRTRATPAGSWRTWVGIDDGKSR